MIDHNEYNNDRERVGDEESVPDILLIFGFLAIFEPPHTRDKNFRIECKVAPSQPEVIIVPKSERREESEGL